MQVSTIVHQDQHLVSTSKVDDTVDKQLNNNQDVLINKIHILICDLYDMEILVSMHN